jgi:hypothetical protein
VIDCIDTLPYIDTINISQLKKNIGQIELDDEIKNEFNDSDEAQRAH